MYTDVLILLVRRQLTRNARFFGAKGILNKRMFHKLGEKRALALPGFHAISGTGITGSFSGKGKRKNVRQLCSTRVSDFRRRKLTNFVYIRCYRKVCTEIV